MGKITINELHKSLFDYVQAVSDDKLETRNKTIVGAINELIQNSNNGQPSAPTEPSNVGVYTGEFSSIWNENSEAVIFTPYGTTKKTNVYISAPVSLPFEPDIFIAIGYMDNIPERQFEIYTYKNIADESLCACACYRVKTEGAVDDDQIRLYKLPEFNNGYILPTISANVNYKYIAITLNESIELNNLANEISNGKQLIADSIGEPLNAEDTFSDMSSDINGLLSTFKTNMMNAGVVVESGDKFKQLIDKIKGLTEGEGNVNSGLDIISATELPVSVKDKQLVVVTDTPMTEAVFHNLQPTIGSDIQEGGVWINTTNNNNVFEYIVSDSPKFSFYILDCYQVISGSYVKKQIYCGVNGTWQHVNPNLYFIQEFINDKPLTKIDGSFANTYNAGTGCQRLRYNTNGGNHSVGGTHKTVKTFNTTGFSKVGIRFSVTHASTVYLRFYDVTTNSQLGVAYGGSSTTVKTLELDIANINDLCYIHVDIDSNNNVSGDYIVDIYDLYLTN